MTFNTLHLFSKFCLSKLSQVLYNLMIFFGTSVINDFWHKQIHLLFGRTRDIGIKVTLIHTVVDGKQEVFWSISIIFFVFCECSYCLLNSASGPAASYSTTTIFSAFFKTLTSKNVYQQMQQFGATENFIFTGFNC